MIRYFAWLAVGVLFMTGNITPVGKILWIAGAVLAAGLLVAGARSPRYFFAFVAGIGVTLIVLAIVNTTYILMLLYGSVLLAAGIVGFAAFGPRTSKADGPETFPRD
ncbi:MAG: hypothetical protein M3Y23_01410 [Actinomycetota bacterium]|nr:hypothetical protein [Actinomycetota bacterium]